LSTRYDGLWVPFADEQDELFQVVLVLGVAGHLAASDHLGERRVGHVGRDGQGGGGGAVVHVQLAGLQRIGRDLQ
jgi:hypothetical protein